ncbi:MAG: 3-oxoacyl-[acyl-carrier-protein] reductase [Melioribacteraceae bacterium]|nr:3-oxoacyl-[acyl-carrier-protein] reductase [Melioribacteraceae bacterium]MDD3557958.1 3-oxoacyl-[acyl-carrier-protein] reductase [Melioribacteraceae bacterium]
MEPKKNKRAIVTGGTRGIGRAIVKELAVCGSKNEIYSDVAFVYNSSDEFAQELISELTRENLKVVAYKADVSSFTDAKNVVDDVIDKLGGVDILVNNAGITRDNLLLRMSENDFDDVIAANLKSVFNFSKAVTPYMIKQRYGRIINVSSVVALIGNPGQTNYVASKAGVLGFTKSMARELSSRNINVNAVAPGFIETDMTKNLNETQRELMIKNIPLGRPGLPEDVAKVVRFLTSADADYITGQVIAVDGGMTM